MKKALSLVLCVVMLLTALPMSGFAAALDEITTKTTAPVSTSEEIDYSSGNTNEELRMPIEQPQETEPEVDGELVEINQYSKVYQTGERTYTAVYGSTPNFFVNEDGEAQEYDNALTLDVGKNTAFTNTSSDIDVRLSTDFATKGMSFDYDGVKVGLTPVEGNYDTYLVVDDAVRYNNVFDGIDVQYTVGKQGVSEDIILTKEVEKNTFSYKLDLNGHYAELIDNVLFVFDKKGDDDCAYSISAPVMTDAAGIVSENVALSLENDVLTVTADSEWLHAVDRSYPVIIDPEIRIDSSIAIRSVVQDGNRVYVSAVPYAYGYVGYINGAYFGFSGVLGRSKMLVHLDSSALNEIPEGSGIISATFNIYQYVSPNSSTNFWCSMITDSWNLSDYNSGASQAFTRAGALNLEFLSSSSSKKGWHSFDIRTAVNNWFNGLDAQNGLMITGQYDTESETGGAFVTNTSAGAEGAGAYAENRPYIMITWELPNPVDVNYDINNTTINLRTIGTSSRDGKLAILGVFADGVAKPNSSVSYVFSDSSAEGQTGTATASYSYKYPDSTAWNDAFASQGRATKYKDILSNWQTAVPFTHFNFNQVYNWNATASKDGVTGNTAKSVDFLVYKITRYDTLASIANYYGVSVDKLATDNHVQDMLLVENNTIIVINPTKNATIPYNPAPLTDDEKAKIDGLLMGRGKHCEFGFEPVNLNSGNFYMNQTDVSVKDYNGDFAIDRTYNSKGAGINSVFGRGWQFEYAETLAKTDVNTFAYHRGDGSTINFYKQSDSLYTSENGYYMTLTPVKVGTAMGDFGGEELEEYDILEYEITMANGEVRRFSSRGLLTKITDEKGFVTSIAYDANNNFASITSPAGQVYSITSANDGKISSVALPNGKTVSFTYNGDDLVGYTNELGYTVTYNYDANHLMTSWTDAENNVIVTNVYDGEGRVTKQTDADGNVTLFAYGDHTTTTTDANGNVTKYYYDDLYRTTKIEYADGTSEIKTYDAGNNLASVTDRNGKTKSYTYNAAGYVLTETRFDGAVKTYTYSEKNDVTKIVDFDGLTTSYAYDAKHNVTSVTAKDGAVTAYEYDANCRMTKLTDANGNATSYAYDGIWVSSETNAKGSTTQYYYDTMGHVVTKIDALGNQTRYMYDAAGRNTGYQTADGNTVTYTYDKAGCMTSLKNAAGYVYNYEYDSMGNVTALTDPLDNTARFTYDGLYNTTSTAYDAEHVTSSTFDAFSQPLTATDEEGNTVTYTYDGAGNVLTRTDARGNTTTYTYDLRFNKVQTFTDAAGGVTTYTYDASGNVASFVDANGNTTEYTYDNVGNLLTVTNPNGRIDSYTYDAVGNVLTKKIGSDDVTTYTYDSVYELTQVEFANGATITYTYDANGNKLTETDSANATSTFTYDAMNRVVTKADGIGRSTAYTYDANGNVLREDHSNGGKTEYVYDALDRLCKVTDSLNNSTSFSYDNVGNRSATTDAKGGVTAYSYTKTGLVASETDPMGGVSAIEYDVNGNMLKATDTEGFTAVMTYDALDRVASLTDALGLVRTYTYDAVGNLIEESDNNGGKTEYTYSPMNYLASVTDALGNTTVNTYDLKGQLTQVTDAKGAVTKYAYDVMGNLTSMTDAEGGVTAMEYDIVGNNTKQTDANGGVYTFSYDKVGRVLKSVDPMNFTTQYKYNDFDLVTEIIDANGSKTTKQYDIGGNLTAEIDANGHKTSYAYDAIYNLTKVTYADNTTNKFAYDLNGNITKATDGNGGEVSFVYNKIGYLTSQTDARGNATTYTRNANGDILTETDALGNATNYAYDRSGRLVKQTLANGAIYSFAYDALGRPTKQTMPEGQFDVFTYDAVGNTTLVTDETNRKTAYTYDKLGRLLTSTDAKGNRTSFAYDKLGNLTSMTTPRGKTTTYAYDANSRLISAAEPATALMKYSYDGVGNLTGTQQGGRINGFTYDKVGNLTSETNALGKVRSYAYDALDRMVKETDYKGNKTEYTYDANDNLTSVTNRLGEQTNYTYDANNNLTRTVDAEGRDVDYYYNQLNWLIGVKEGGVTSQYSYDSVGNLTSAGGYTYTYNLNGDVLTATNAIGNVTEYVYNQNGMLAQTVNADKTTVNYDYDEIDELVSKTYDDGEQAALFAYDKDGNRVSMTDLAGVTSYEYDDAGRVTAIILYNGVSRITYKYNEFGELVELGYPDATRVTYAYDDLGRLTEMTDRDGEKVTYAYDDNGNLTEVHRANETWTEIKYDDEDRVTAIENHGYFTIGKWHLKSVLSSKYTYEYDGSGNIVSESVYEYITDCSLVGLIKYIFTRLKNEHKTTTYTYDGRNQLTGVSESEITWLFNRTKEHSTEYKYDLSGNRTSKTVDGVETVYTYNEAGQLLSEKTGKDTITYTYDANGNQISKSEPGVLCKTDVTTYEYDNENRLKAVKENGTLLMAMLYDGDGIRTFTAEKTEDPCKIVKNAFELGPIPGSFNQSAGNSGSNSHSSEADKDIYDLLLVPNGVDSKKYAYYDLTQYFNNVNTEYAQVLLERAADGKTKAVYEYGMFRERAEINGTDYTYEYDGRGSVIAITTSNAKKVSTYSYDEFGVTTSAGQCVDNPYQYNAEYTDDLTGMQYLRARYYNAQTGSFITADTYAGRVTTPLSLNRYAYTHNNPLIGRDPSGHFILTAIVVGAVVGAAIGGGISTYKEVKKAKADPNYKVNGWNILKGAAIGGAVGAIGGAATTLFTAAAAGVSVSAVTGSTFASLGYGATFLVGGGSAVVSGIANRGISGTWDYLDGTTRYSSWKSAAANIFVNTFNPLSMAGDFLIGGTFSVASKGAQQLLSKYGPKVLEKIREKLKFCDETQTKKIEKPSVESSIEVPKSNEPNTISSSVDAKKPYQITEDSVHKSLGPDYHDQVTITKDMKAAPYGTKDAIRIDDLKTEVNGQVVDSSKVQDFSKVTKFDVIEEKNYMIETSSGRSRLVKNIVEQSTQRNEYLTQSGAVVEQTYYVDTVDHNISIGQIDRLYNTLTKKVPDNVDIHFMWER